MNGSASIQPPGLMKMRLMHHQGASCDACPTRCKNAVHIWVTIPVMTHRTGTEGGTLLETSCLWKGRQGLIRACRRCSLLCDCSECSSPNGERASAGNADTLCHLPACHGWGHVTHTAQIRLISIRLSIPSDRGFPEAQLPAPGGSPYADLPGRFSSSWHSMHAATYIVTADVSMIVPPSSSSCSGSIAWAPCDELLHYVWGRCCMIAP